jgi:hypothetical protein
MARAGLTAYHLDGDTYRDLGTWTTGQTARQTDPFPVEIPIDQLG